MINHEKKKFVRANKPINEKMRANDASGKIKIILCKHDDGYLYVKYIKLEFRKKK